MGAGLALVQIMSASQLERRSLRSAVESVDVMSQTTTLSGGMTILLLLLLVVMAVAVVPDSNACRDSSERTVPMGV